jgi:hypothetical protein
MPAMGTIARRGLTPLLVLLVVAPPRVCTCEHEHAPASQVAHEDADDEPTPCHPHGPGPVDDPDCPCMRPAQVKATLPAGIPTALPPGPRPVFVLPEPTRPADRNQLSIDHRTGDPPLYLTGCALRF